MNVARSVMNAYVGEIELTVRVDDLTARGRTSFTALVSSPTTPKALLNPRRPSDSRRRRPRREERLIPPGSSIDRSVEAELHRVAELGAVLN
jgi:hypothetical protein